MNKRGFTLIELILVIAIIGVLSTIIVVFLGSARLKARDTKRTADLKQIGTALELYYADKNGYPIATDLILGTGNAVCLNGSGWQAAGCADPYMGIVPKDPLSSNYTYDSDGTTYTVEAVLEDQTAGLTGTIIESPVGLHQAGP